MILSCVIPTIVCVTVILGLMITKVSMFVCQIATPSPGASSSTSRNSGSNRTPPRMTSDGASGKSGHGVEGTTAPSASKPALEDPWAFLEDELAEFQRVVAELEALRLKAAKGAVQAPDTVPLQVEPTGANKDVDPSTSSSCPADPDEAAAVASQTKPEVEEKPEIRPAIRPRPFGLKVADKGTGKKVCPPRKQPVPVPIPVSPTASSPNSAVKPGPSWPIRRQCPPYTTV